MQGFLLGAGSLGCTKHFPLACTLSELKRLLVTMGQCPRHPFILFIAYILPHEMSGPVFQFPCDLSYGHLEDDESRQDIRQVLS